MNKITENSIKKTFQSYFKFTKNPDGKKMIDFLNEIYNLNENLINDFSIRESKKEKGLMKYKEFIILKYLKSEFNNNENEFKNLFIIPTLKTKSISELSHLCIVEKKNIISAIDKVSIKFKNKKEDVIKSLTSYNEFIDINPFIFNLMVRIYQYCRKNKLKININEYKEFTKSYDFETQNNISHFVSSHLNQNIEEIKEIIKKEKELNYIFI